MTILAQNIKHANEIGIGDKPPVLAPDEVNYYDWKDRFIRFIRAKDIKIWFCIQTGLGAHAPLSSLTYFQFHGLTEEDKQMYGAEEKAITYLTNALPKSIFHTFGKKETSKDLCDSVIARFEGNATF